MCGDCSKKPTVKGPAVAAECGHPITTSDKKFCPACALERGVCEKCGGNMNADKPQIPATD